MNLERAQAIANAVLYEGYILYPYRASAVKNQQRFNFGVIAPQAYSEEMGGSEAWSIRTECLIEGDDPVVDVRVRGLQLVARDVFQRLPAHANDSCSAAPRFERVPMLEVESVLHHTWQEAVEREIVLEGVRVRDLIAHPQRRTFRFEAETTAELLRTSSGENVGRVTRRQFAIQGCLSVRANSPAGGPCRLMVEIQNTTPLPPAASPGAAAATPEPFPATPREIGLLHSLASVHTILAAHGGEFVSLFDPPPQLAALAAACQSQGAWPVLVGAEGERNLLLAAPIILYDYPQIAPESGGDYCDGTEIDEMLALRVLTLTEEEKREMQHVDERARQILERTAALPPEQWQKLHGAIRGLKAVQPN